MYLLDYYCPIKIELRAHTKAVQLNKYNFDKGVVLALSLLRRQIMEMYNISLCEQCSFVFYNWSCSPSKKTTPTLSNTRKNKM